MEKFFNFNNEQALTPIDVDSATGEVTFELDGETTTFTSDKEFAELYADARNVVADNLKNWALIEDGDTYSFILRAGSAGVDPRDLASVARALRESGMAPAEVARAMVSVQEEERAEQERQYQAAYTESLIDSKLNRLAGTTDEKLLFLAYDVTNADELKDALENDAELFEGDDYADDEDLEDYDEYDEYDMPSPRDASDIFSDNLRQKISDQKDEIADMYPGVPSAIAVSIVLAEPIDEMYGEGAVEAFVKAKRVASVAGRKVPITVIDAADASAPVITSTFHDRDGVNLDEGDLFVYGRRFILVKNLTPVLQGEKEFVVEVDTDDESDGSVPNSDMDDDYSFDDGDTDY